MTKNNKKKHDKKNDEKHNKKNMTKTDKKNQDHTSNSMKKSVQKHALLNLKKKQSGK